MSPLPLTAPAVRIARPPIHMTRKVSRLWREALQRPVVYCHPRRLFRPSHLHTIHQHPRAVSTMDPSTKMARSNRLQQVLAEATRPAMGFWQMLPGANISRILARSGADWILVDCEHGNIDGRMLAGRQPMLYWREAY